MAKEQAKAAKLNAKIWANGKKQNIKNKIQDAKEAVLNSKPVRFARRCKKRWKKGF